MVTRALVFYQGMFSKILRSHDMNLRPNAQAKRATTSPVRMHDQPSQLTCRHKRWNKPAGSPANAPNRIQQNPTGISWPKLHRNKVMSKWLVLQSVAGTVTNVVVAVIGLIAYFRRRHIGWLALSVWSLLLSLAFPLGLVVDKMRISQVAAFAILGLVCDVLLLFATCMLAFSAAKMNKREHPPSVKLDSLSPP